MVHNMFNITQARFQKLKSRAGKRKSQQANSVVGSSDKTMRAIEMEGQRHGNDKANFTHNWLSNEEGTFTLTKKLVNKLKQFPDTWEG